MRVCLYVNSADIVTPLHRGKWDGLVFVIKHIVLPFSLDSAQFAPDAESDTVAVDRIPEDWMGLDVGPKTISTFQEALAPCKTIVRDDDWTT